MMQPPVVMEEHAEQKIILTIKRFSVCAHDPKTIESHGRVQMNSPAATHNIETAATEISALPAQTIIRLKHVIALTGLSRSTIYDRMNPKSKRYDASFPKSIKLGATPQAGAVGWIESEIQAWIQQCIAERTKQLCN